MLVGGFLLQPNAFKLDIDPKLSVSTTVLSQSDVTHTYLSTPIMTQRMSTSDVMPNSGLNVRVGG